MSPDGSPWQQRRGTRAALAALWLALFGAISVLALAPQPVGPPSTGWDKLDHLAAFAVLSGIGSLVLAGRRVGWLLLGLCAYGGLIEWLQMGIEGRAAEWGDWLADVAGVLLGWLASKGLLKLTSRR